MLKEITLIAVNTSLKEYLDCELKTQNLTKQLLADHTAGTEPPINVLFMICCVENDLMATLAS